MRQCVAVFRNYGSQCDRTDAPSASQFDRNETWVLSISKLIYCFCHFRIQLGMHRARAQTGILGLAILGLDCSRTRLFSGSVILGLGYSRARLFSGSAILGLGHSRARLFPVSKIYVNNCLHNFRHRKWPSPRMTEPKNNRAREWPSPRMAEPENGRAREWQAREWPSPRMAEPENGKPENSRARESPSPRSSGSVHA